MRNCVRHKSHVASKNVLTLCARIVATYRQAAVILLTQVCCAVYTDLTECRYTVSMVRFFLLGAFPSYFP